jgi:hypothetical protein
LQQSSPEAAEDYNSIAKQYGLTEITPRNAQRATLEQDGTSSASNTTAKPTPKKTLFQRLSRKHSVSRISSRRPLPSSTSLSLEDLCRLGGISIFTLPAKYAPFNLVVPSALAATAEYILKHGRETSGIFRIPGQSIVVNMIYDYYKSRITTVEDAKDVEETICSTSLPVDVVYCVHDIASAFKRFLWDLPGGILGSSTLFRSLAEIQAVFREKAKTAVVTEKHLQSKLIALVLLSMTSDKRFAVICAVFGLLAYLKKDESNEVPSSSATEQLNPESMSSHALGVVFAPILLGDLTNEIEFHDGRKGSESASIDSTPKRSLLAGKKLKKLKSSDCGPAIAASVSRANAAAIVVELLVQHWEDIVRQIISLRIKPRSNSRSISQTSLGRSTRIVKERDGHRIVHHPSVPSMTTRRSHSLSKSISNPDLLFPNIGSSGPSRSTSVSHGSLGQAGSGETRNVSYSSTALQSISETGRWPSLQLVDRRPLRSAVPSDESVPWWERGSSDQSALSDGVLESRSSPVPAPPNNSTYSRFTGTDATEYSVASTKLAPESRDSPHLVNKSSISPSILQVRSQAAPQTDTTILPASGPPSLAKLLVPSASLDSVLSPISRINRATVAQASHRSLQQSMRHDGQLPQTPIAMPAPQVSSQDTTSSGRKESPSNTAVRRTPRPKPAPMRNASSTPASRTQKRSCHEIGSSPQKTKPRPADTPEVPTLGSDRDQDSNVLKAPAVLPRSDRPSPRRALAPQQGVPDHRGGLDHATGSTTTDLDLHLQPTSRERQLLPFPDEPAIARRLNFRPSPRQPQSTRSTSEEYCSETEYVRGATTKPNIGTLYAEIRRLKNEVDVRQEETLQLRHQLDAMRRFKDSGTLAEKLREAEREKRFWRHRAQWAEDNLFRKREAQERQGESRRDADRR